MSARSRSFANDGRAADNGRKAVCRDTVDRTPVICAETPGASLDSTFVKLPDLLTLSASDASYPNLTRAPIRILNSDTFAVTHQLLRNNPDANSKVAVLNLASDQQPAGG